MTLRLPSTPLLLMSVHELWDNGQELRLVKMRNPWGHKEWEGDWCDSSELWTEELIEMLEVE